MGATLHWREPPRRDVRSFETSVEFGGGRRSGKGFMAYSERAGPGVLLLAAASPASAPVLEFARVVHGDGFTVLAPDIDPGRDSGSVDEGPLGSLAAAADYLTDNWHPRLGVVGFDRAADLAARLARQRGFDAVVLYGGGELVDLVGMVPVLGHFPAAAADEVESATLRSDGAGVEPELHLYESGGSFIDPQASGFAVAEVRRAHARTLDFLHYYLS